MKQMILGLGIAMMLTLGAGTVFAQATVTTDQSDYAPESTVFITGSGFQAGETVQLQVINLTNPSDTNSEHDPWPVTADTNGNFQATWYVTDDEAGATLQLTATGLTSRVTAQTLFTDGNASDGSGTMTVSPSTATAKSIASYAFSFRTDNGKDYNSGSQATIVVPAGWSAPQITDSSAAGYLRITPVLSGSTASLASIAGSGPWTITINFSCTQNNSGGFDLNYTNAAAASAPGTYTFAAQTKNNGGTLTSLASSPSVAVVVGSASKLAFITSAQTLTAGVNSGVITVQIQDAGGNPTNATVARPINLSSTSGSGVFKTMSGTAITSITIAVGQSSTNLLYYDTLAGNPTITAASTSPTILTSATQVEIVTPAAANKLVMKTEPSSSVTAGATFVVQPAVYVEDTYGNVVTSDGSTVTATVGTGTGPLTGTTTAVAAGGVATFSALAAPTLAQSGLKLTFTDGSLAGTADTTSITVNPAAVSAAQSTVSASPGSVNANGSTTSTITVTLKDAYNNPVSGKTVTLASSRGATDTISAASGASSSSGIVTFTVKSIATGSAVFTATDSTDSTTITQTATVIFTASSTTALSSSANPTLPGGSVTFTATISPVAPSTGSPTGNVTFKDGSTTLGTGTLNGSGVATFATSSLAHGNHSLTAAYAGDTYISGSTSGTLTQTIDFPPAAGTHYLSAVMSTARNVSASTLASLDSDADGDALTITSVSSAGTNGVSTISFNGTTITYNPGNYAGADQFTYVVSDGFPGGTNQCMVQVTVSLGKATSAFNAIAATNGVVNLRGYGIPGHQYDVQRSPDTSFSSYVTLTPTVTAAANGIVLFTDNSPPLGGAFYRFAVH